MGNILNLAIAAGISLANWDLRQLNIIEVDFQNLQLPGVDCQEAVFDRCRFSQSMGSILCLMFSPDGRYLAASDSSYQIKLWDLVADREVALLLGHQGWVWHLAFSPNGKYLLSGSSDRTIRVWELATGSCLQVLDSHQDWVWRVAFGLGNNLAISIGADRYLKIWLWRTGRNLFSLKIPDIQAHDGSIHGRRGLLAVCSTAGLKIWQMWTGRCLWEITTPDARNLRSVAFSPDGKLLLAASFKCELHCWDLDRREHRFRSIGHPTQIFYLGYDKAGQGISACLEQVRLWNLEDGTCTQTIDIARDSGKGFAYRPPLLVTGSDNGVVKMWNLATGKCLHNGAGTAARIMELATNGTNRRIATFKDDGTLSIWDLDGLNPLPSRQVYEGHRGMCTALAFNRHGNLLASTGSDRVIRIWDVDRGTTIQSLMGHTDYIQQLRFIDDLTLFSHSGDGTSRQWALAAGTYEVLADPRQQWWMAVDCSPDYRQIALGSIVATVTIIDRQTRALTELQAVGNRLRQLTYTSDGSQLVGITDDGYLNCWNLHDRYLHRHWRIGDLQTTSLVAHPLDPHQLIVATEDGEIAIWDLQQQCCIDRVNSLPPGQFRAHHQAISSLRTIPHPHQLISCNVAGTIQLWNFTPGGLQSVYTLDVPKPYQDLNLIGAKGLNRSQLATLDRLGALLNTSMITDRFDR